LALLLLRISWARTIDGAASAAGNVAVAVRMIWRLCNRLS
jgi:hypothetical protein